ncbi:hypothetical protein [Actinophytocola oryzae]|uniref:hypothetical protein n=1 Tax=Actinophytocola oryzae TaxID=502181 RepID=UPI00106350DD|nr:hypothetical protein [Actinophytocola oryzae]
MALSVVRSRTLRAWTVVAAVAVVAVLVPQVPGWLPVSAAQVDPATLRQRVQGSTDRPYQGFAEVSGTLALPELPNLRDLTALLTSTTRVRTWYAGPSRWRFDVVSPVAERDVYGTPDGEYTWDYGANQLTRLVGEVPVRVPRAGDLTPPELARRILSTGQGDPVTALPARRVAGRDAAGLRVTPRDPDTTIGYVDLWALPDTGVPLAVEVVPRGASRPVLTSTFVEYDPTTPPDDVLVPKHPEGSGFGVVAAPGIADVLGALGRARLPGQLAGRDLRQANAAGVRGVGVYGSGLSAFIAVPVPGEIGGEAVDAFTKAGGSTEDVPSGEVTRLTIAPLSVAVVRSDVSRRSWLLAGLTDSDVLLAAASDLAARPWSRR